MSCFLDSLYKQWLLVWMSHYSRTFWNILPQQLINNASPDTKFENKKKKPNTIHTFKNNDTSITVIAWLIVNYQMLPLSIMVSGSYSCWWPIHKTQWASPLSLLRCPVGAIPEIQCSQYLWSYFRLGLPSPCRYTITNTVHKRYLMPLLTASPLK